MAFKSAPATTVGCYLFLYFYLICGPPGLAQGQTQHISVRQLISNSQSIVVCKVAAINPDPSAVLPQPNAYTIVGGKKQWFYAGEASELIALMVQAPKIYTVSTLRSLYGPSPPTRLSVPAIVASSYGLASFSVTPGEIVLLFLKTDPRGGFVPTAPLLPLAPLSETPKDLGLGTSMALSESDLYQTVIRLVTVSLADQEIRRADTYILANEVDPAVVYGLAPYIDDPDIETRANVLNAMLINQQVICIPRAAEIEHEVEDRDNNTEVNVIAAFDQLTTTEAIPYVNPLCWDSYAFVRTKALQTLLRLHDSSSAPYLVLACRDPDLDVRQQAAAVLQMIAPPLDSSNGNTASLGATSFEDRAEDWWKDELNGVHPRSLWSAPAASSPLPTSADDLHHLLWLGDGNYRERVIAALAQKATKQDVPYLLLALLDPDATVAHTAAVSLIRVLNVPGKIPSLEDFSEHRDNYCAPLWAWWSDELMGKHRPAPVERPNDWYMSRDALEAIKAQVAAKDLQDP